MLPSAWWCRCPLPYRPLTVAPEAGKVDSSLRHAGLPGSPTALPPSLLLVLRSVLHVPLPSEGSLPTPC